MKFLSILFAAVVLVTAQAVSTQAHAAQDTTASGPQRYTLNRIVAVVNSDVILESELNVAVDQVLAQLDKKGSAQPDRKALVSQVL